MATGAFLRWANIKGFVCAVVQIYHVGENDLFLESLYGTQYHVNMASKSNPYNCAFIRIPNKPHRGYILVGSTRVDIPSS